MPAALVCWVPNKILESRLGPLLIMGAFLWGWVLLYGFGRQAEPGGRGPSGRPRERLVDWILLMVSGLSVATGCVWGGCAGVGCLSGGGILSLGVKGPAGHGGGKGPVMELMGASLPNVVFVSLFVFAFGCLVTLWFRVMRSTACGEG